ELEMTNERLFVKALHQQVALPDLQRFNVTFFRSAVPRKRTKDLMNSDVHDSQASMGPGPKKPIRKTVRHFSHAAAKSEAANIRFEVVVRTGPIGCLG